MLHVDESDSYMFWLIKVFCWKNNIVMKTLKGTYVRHSNTKAFREMRLFVEDEKDRCTVTKMLSLHTKLMAIVLSCGHHSPYSMSAIVTNHHSPHNPCALTTLTADKSVQLEFLRYLKSQEAYKISTIALAFKGKPYFRGAPRCTTLRILVNP